MLSVMLRYYARDVNFQKVNEKKCKYFWLLPLKPVEENNTKQIHIVNIFCLATVVANCGNPYKISCATTRLTEVYKATNRRYLGFSPFVGKPREGEEVLCLDMSSGMTGMSIN